MLITTPHSAPSHLIERAISLAKETGAMYVEREQAAIPMLMQKYGQLRVVVVLEKGVRLYGQNVPTVDFHPSLGLVRMKRLQKGCIDPMLKACDFHVGDTVIDCTAGLGADALVFSFAAGCRGRVIACESSWPLYVLLLEGMRRYETSVKQINAAFRRIEVKHEDHLNMLSLMDSRSSDVVYFDPMFRKPLIQSSAIRQAEHLVNASHITEESIAQARRVARKRIVMKEQRQSPEFARLGFQVIEGGRSAIAYGIIDV